MQVQKVFVNGVNRGLFPFGIIQEGYVKNKFIVKLLMKREVCRTKNYVSYVGEIFLLVSGAPGKGS